MNYVKYTKTQQEILKSCSSWPNGHGVWLRTRRFQVRVLAGKIFFAKICHYFFIEIFAVNCTTMIHNYPNISFIIISILFGVSMRSTESKLQDIPINHLQPIISSIHKEQNCYNNQDTLYNTTQPII